MLDALDDMVDACACVDDASDLVDPPGVQSPPRQIDCIRPPSTARLTPLI